MQRNPSARPFSPSPPGDGAGAGDRAEGERSPPGLIPSPICKMWRFRQRRQEAIPLLFLEMEGKEGPYLYSLKNIQISGPVQFQTVFSRVNCIWEFEVSQES